MRKPQLHFSFIILTLCFFLSAYLLSAQDSSVYHWETAVFADDVWAYRLGESHPPPTWNQPGFNDDGWMTGQGGIGYGDEDDNTVIPPVPSVYMRHEFTVADTSTLLGAVFHADYDDAFVAYLNGFEISRENIGEQGVMPFYFELAYGDHEAQLYQGENPTAFFISKDILNQWLVEGENVLAAQVHNWNLNSSDLSSNFFLSFVMDQSASQFGPTPPWFFEPLISSNLPLVFIDTDGQEIVDEPRIEAWMQVIDNGPGNRNYRFDPPNNYDGRIAIEIRGASSQFFFPKKNYGFETQDSLGENNNVSLLGMPEENDWVLHGPYSDKTLLRNVLTYHLGRATSRYAPRTRMCELFINNEYYGVYVMTERIKRDNNRVDIAKLTQQDISGDELTGGYIFQIDRDNGGLSTGWYSAYTPSMFYVYDDPDYDELQPEQKIYIKTEMTHFEAVMEGPDYDDPQIGYAHLMDIGSFIDYFLVNEITKEVDAFKLSTFMYKDKDSNDPKLHMGPLWDFNLGYGNFDYCDSGYEGWAYDFAQNCASILPSWLFRMLEIDAVTDEMRCRWDDLRQNKFHTDTLLNYIDSMVLVLDEAQQRNFERWPVLGTYVWPNPQIGQTYEEEVDYMKNWLEDRLNWIDQNLPGLCMTTSIGDPDAVNDFSVKAFPVPFSSLVQFKMPEGSDHLIEIFDNFGRKLISIGGESPIWNGVSSNGETVPPGIYYFRLIRNGVPLHTGKLIRH